MLDQIPSEVLSVIAFHVSWPTLAPPIPLLQTNKAIYDSIAPRENARLYARLFRTAFDSAAAQRRLGGLHARQFVQELKTRVIALRRIERMVRAQNVSDIRVTDLWVVYIMMIENDGRNIQHFIPPHGSVHLDAFLRLYHEQHLLAAAVMPGYPAETTEAALIMWISWLLAGYESTRRINMETQEQLDERLFVLRPYVFAPHRYELCFAPWTIADLPIVDHEYSEADRNPFVADLTPKARKTHVQHFGSTLEVTGPMLSHAAILLFFVKRPTETVEEQTVISPLDAFLGRGGGQQTQRDLERMTLDQDPEGNDPRSARRPKQRRARSDEDDEDDDQDDSDSDSSSSLGFGSIRDLISRSSNHDRDFTRLQSCYDPFICRGMKRSAWRGSWEGCWEGNFTFFDFDAFRNMLAGNNRALYEGSYGEQAQVWRLKETWVWRSDWAAKKRKQREREKAEREKRRQERIDNGEEVSDEEVKPSVKGKTRGLPLTGPATNAGFPTDLPPSTSAGLATAEAEAVTLRETIAQQVDAIKGFEVVPDSELEQALDEPDGGEEAGLEMILTGVGHSAWGRFILKGKVRAWDGMASLVKEYAPDSRGKWIYRGYVVSGDIFVGRWRDTFTAEEYVGYEGTFILNRR